MTDRPTRRMVRARLLLAGGHTQEVELAEDAAELQALFEVLAQRSASARDGAPMFQLPLDGGRGAFTFHPSRLVSIVTEPPVLVRFEETESSPEKVSRPWHHGRAETLRPRRNDGVRESRLADRTVLEIPGCADSLTLNASAAAIWELCDDSRTMDEISSELERGFELEPGALRRDVEHTIEMLCEAQALELIAEG